MFWLLAGLVAVALLLWGGTDRPRRPRDPLQRMREDGCL